MDRTSEEIKRRIKLSIAAYAYEIENDSIMPDTTFDELQITRVNNGELANLIANSRHVLSF